MGVGISDPPLGEGISDSTPGDEGHSDSPLGEGHSDSVLDEGNSDSAMGEGNSDCPAATTICVALPLSHSVLFHSSNVLLNELGVSCHTIKCKRLFVSRNVPVQ